MNAAKRGTPETDTHQIPNNTPDSDNALLSNHAVHEQVLPAVKTTQPSSQWTLTQKWLTVTTACLICFVAGTNATALLSATEEISIEFDVDTTRFDYSFFIVTAWNVGAAIIPLFILPLMEDFGIRTIYYVVYILFVVFVVVQGVARNFATLIVARAIAGSCGGVLQNCVDGIIADVWGEDIHNRALSITVYIFALLGGVTFGPVMGGAVIKYLSWRWIIYIQLIIYGALAPYILLTLRDPRPNAKPNQPLLPLLRAALNETVLRAIRMLTTEFVVASFTLLSSFAFGTVFILTQSIPQVYTGLYDWTEWQTGLVQSTILLGEFVGVLLCVVQDKLIYPRYASRHGITVPEPRLYTVIPASVLGLTAGFFIYAWTTSPGISWLAPSAGLFLIGVGIMVIVQGLTTYVTDCYASHASSAISGVAFGENMFAAFLPLATRDMYTTLGFGWASSLLGFVGFVLSLAPVVLVLKGDKVRANSRFAG